MSGIIDKKIGLLGGVGPQATDFIYRKIIEIAQKKYNAENNDDYPRVLIDSIPVPDFISDTKNIDIAKKMLVESAESLVLAGATKLCIGSNTVHILLGALEKEVNIEFISMVELVGEKCKQKNFKKAGLLGTPVLINSGIYQTELSKYGIELILPTKKQIEISDRVIRDVIAGKTESSKKGEYIGVLTDIFNNGAQGIILGCTELPMALNYEALGDRTISSDEVLAEGIVDYYYSTV